MLETIIQFSSFAPIVIFVAAILDIFFATGLILYGAAMLSSIVMMHAAGIITVEMIVFSAYIGTVFGNTLNYGAGHLFGETKFISKKLANPKIKTARDFLQNRGLFLFILGCRFFAITRPLYALVLGSLEIKFYRFLFYEIIIALFWILFWLFLLVQGEKVLFFLFN
jgi:membrane-associated protein